MPESAVDSDATGDEDEDDGEEATRKLRPRQQPTTTKAASSTATVATPKKQRGRTATAAQPLAIDSLTRAKLSLLRWDGVGEVPPDVLVPREGTPLAKEALMFPYGYTKAHVGAGCATNLLSRLGYGWEARFLAVQWLFYERPAWTRSQIFNRLLVGEVDDSMLARVAYEAKEGAWAGVLFRFGYDPRKDPHARAFQTIKWLLPSDVALHIRDRIWSGVYPISRRLAAERRVLPGYVMRTTHVPLTLLGVDICEGLNYTMMMEIRSRAVRFALDEGFGETEGLGEGWGGGHLTASFVSAVSAVMRSAASDVAREAKKLNERSARRGVAPGSKPWPVEKVSWNLRLGEMSIHPWAVPLRGDAGLESRPREWSVVPPLVPVVPDSATSVASVLGDDAGGEEDADLHAQLGEVERQIRNVRERRVGLVLASVEEMRAALAVGAVGATALVRSQVEDLLRRKRDVRSALDAARAARSLKAAVSSAALAPFALVGDDEDEDVVSAPLVRQPEEPRREEATPAAAATTTTKAAQPDLLPLPKRRRTFRRDGTEVKAEDKKREAEAEDAALLPLGSFTDAWRREGRMPWWRFHDLTVRELRREFGLPTDPPPASSSSASTSAPKPVSKAKKV